MAQKWANNAFSTLGGAIDSTDTSITVATNTGDRFPAVSGDDFFNITLQNAGGDVEIVKVISRAIGSDQMTIVRGQEATVPLSWAIGDIVELRPTAASFENISDDIADVVTDVSNLQTTVNELDFNADAIGFDDDAVSFEAENVQDAIGQLDQSVLDAITTAIQASGMAAPPGAVQTFARNTSPDGWLEADGSNVSRTEYEDLFAAIGTTFGAGDGSTTFGLPDLRGEFLRGWDNGRGVDSGRSFGSFQEDENKEHSHGGSIGSVGNHSHGFVGPGTGNRAAGDVFTFSATQNRTTSGGGSHSHSLSINNAGGNESRPRNVALLVCIKT